MVNGLDSASEDAASSSSPTEVLANVSKRGCANYTVYQHKIGAMDLTHISLQCTVFLLGLSGNLILVYIIASHKRLRTTPNLFITNLAAADCVYLMLFIPCDIISKFGVQLPVFICKVIYFCRIITVGVSVYTLVALSIDRCLAITRPMSKLKSSRPGLISKLGLGAIWTAAVALATPYAISSNIKVERQRCQLIKHCFPFPTAWGRVYMNAMAILKLLLYYLLPGALIAVFYGLMAGKLMRTARAHERAAAASERANASAASQIESRKKLAKLVLCLAAVFFFAWGLEYIVMLHFLLSKKVPEAFVWIKMIAKLLSSAYSASNPITLCIISKRFRAHFLQVVASCCCCCQRLRPDGGGGSAWTAGAAATSARPADALGARRLRKGSDNVQGGGSGLLRAVEIHGAAASADIHNNPVDDEDSPDSDSFKQGPGSTSVQMTHMARREAQPDEVEPMLPVCQL